MNKLHKKTSCFYSTLKNFQPERLVFQHKPETLPSSKEKTKSQEKPLDFSTPEKTQAEKIREKVHRALPGESQSIDAVTKYFAKATKIDSLGNPVNYTIRENYDSKLTIKVESMTRDPKFWKRNSDPQNKPVMMTQTKTYSDLTYQDLMETSAETDIIELRQIIQQKEKEKELRQKNVLVENPENLKAKIKEAMTDVYSQFYMMGKTEFSKQYSTDDLFYKDFNERLRNVFRDYQIPDEIVQKIKNTESPKDRRKILSAEYAGLTVTYESKSPHFLYSPDYYEYLKGVYEILQKDDRLARK